MRNTPGSKTADRRRPLPSIGLGWRDAACRIAAECSAASSERCCLVAAAGENSSRRIARRRSKQRAIKRIDTAKPDSTAADSAHATRLKWLPYQSASSLRDRQPAIRRRQTCIFRCGAVASAAVGRVINDPAIVRAQAVQPGNPNSNPFGDEPNQPNAQPLPLPAPTTPTRSRSKSAGARRARLGPAGPRLVRGRSRPRAPARLNPDLPLETPTAPSAGPAPATPFITPSPSDIEDLSCTTHQKPLPGR